MNLQPPSPRHILRSHAAEVNSLYVSFDNLRLYSGDSSGLAVCTSTVTLRSITVWKAHTDGFLRIEEWEGKIVTHGRDNKLHVWTMIAAPATLVDAAPESSGLPSPRLLYSLDVNALNFCRFSLLPVKSPARIDGDHEAYLAVPNLVDSSVVDVWSIPSSRRVHAAIGKGIATDVDGRESKRGLAMTLHLFNSSNAQKSIDSKRLLVGYENGSVTLHACKPIEEGKSEQSIEGRGWEEMWTSKLHAEAVMGMAVSKDCLLGLSVSADHIIGRYSLLDVLETDSLTAHRTKHAGHSAVALRDSGRVCIVAGWDGNVRLYGTKSLKTLGTLKYHKDSCYAVTFAHSDQTPEGGQIVDEEDENEFEEDEKEKRKRWAMSAGKDGRVVIWELASFENPTKTRT